jgi:hypothetical protein
MSTLVTARTRTLTPTERIGMVSLALALLKAFAPAPRQERTLNDERTLRRELWMLGGQ